MRPRFLLDCTTLSLGADAVDDYRGGPLGTGTSAVVGGVCVIDLSETERSSCVRERGHEVYR
jgi:hypothetical protein